MRRKVARLRIIPGLYITQTDSLLHLPCLIKITIIIKFPLLSGSQAVSKSAVGVCYLYITMTNPDSDLTTYKDPRTYAYVSVAHIINLSNNQNRPPKRLPIISTYTKLIHEFDRMITSIKLMTVINTSRHC